MRIIKDALKMLNKGAREKMNHIQISIDTGKSNTKFAWFHQNEPHLDNIKLDAFRTVVKQVNPVEVLSTDHLVYFEDSYYDIGGTDERVLESSNTKLSPKHELCVYQAIARVFIQMGLTGEPERSVDLSINVPLHEFKTIRAEYGNKYFGKSVQISVGNQAVAFAIENVHLAYEGQGAVITNTTTHTGAYYVIDIGGKNDTHILFQNLRPHKEINDITNNGVLGMLQLVASDLSHEYEFTMAHVEAILKGHRAKPEGFDDIFKARAMSLVQKINNQMQKFKLNPLFIDAMIFSGGGSLILKELLEAEFSDFQLIFAHDALFDNAKGALVKMVGS